MWRKIVFAALCVAVGSWGSAGETDPAHVWIQTHDVPEVLRSVETWDFTTPALVEMWGGFHACKVTHAYGALRVEMTGGDPYFSASVDLARHGLPHSSQWVLRLRLRKSDRDTVSLYWGESENPGFDEARRASGLQRPVPGEWLDLDIPFETATPLTRLRLDLSSDQGLAEITRMELLERRSSTVEMTVLPMEPARTRVRDRDVAVRQSVRLTNRDTNAGASARLDGIPITFGPGESKEYVREFAVDGCVIAHTWTLECEGFPPVTHSVAIPTCAAPAPDWKQLRAGDARIHVSPGLEAAQIYVQDRLVGALVPCPGAGLEVHGGEIRARGRAGGETVVLHVLDPVVFGVLPGVELLEAGEWSSSKLDLEIPEHNRFAPPPDWLTQQWMGMATEFATFRLQWSRPELQPTFATPNFVDGTSGGRMSVRLGEGDTLSVCVASATGEAARDAEALCLAGALRQRELCGRQALDTAADLPTEKLFGLYREALESDVLRDENGWGHCAGERWARHPFSGHASALWQLGGEVAESPALVQGGTHVENSVAFFLTGQAERFYAHELGRGRTFRDTLTPDGAVLYDGQYRAGHFENHALGTSASRAFHMLGAYAVSGDETLLEAGLRALRFSRRYAVARGAQCWEMPLHTPDLLADAHSIRGNVLAYRLTGDREFLDEARRRAVEGLTFIYLWDAPERPFQFGASIGVLGATNWRSPNWLGRPVQWIGTVYAYALLEFADVLRAEDAAAADFWRDLAAEITRSTERQMYREGPFRGLLPDSVDPTSTDLRFAWNINPVVPAMLRLRLMGRQADVDIRWNDRHRVVSPYRTTTLEGDAAVVDVTRDGGFQLLVDGKPVAVEGKVGPMTVELAR